MADAVMFGCGMMAGLGASLGICWLLFRRRRKGTESNLPERLLAEWGIDEGGLNAHRRDGGLEALAESTGRLLKRDERRLSAVIAAMFEGVAIMDDSRRIVFCNPSFKTTFRLQEGSVFSPGLIAPDAVRDVEAALETVAETRKVATLELRLATTPPRDILLALTPHSDGEIKGGFIATAIDISVRKRAESMRTEFVANVSHELRTPLAAIRGYVETLLEPIEPGMAPVPYDKFLKIVHQHVMRLNALIEDILILSRIESKGMQLQPQPLQLSVPVEASFNTLLRAAQEKNITLTNALPDQLPDAKADQSAVERILLNLIENAIKYSDPKSEVIVTARIEGGDILVIVRDQGLGIPKEDQGRIFERFYRVDKARSRKAGGTGLGLSIVKHLVQSMNGEVWVDSEPGRGSDFLFTLPLAHGTPGR